MSKLLPKYAIALSMVATLLVCRPLPAQASSNDGKPDLAKLVRDLVANAKRVRRISKEEPSIDGKVGIKYRVVEDVDKKVFKYLASRNDRDPSIDGYVKRQLMDIQPDFRKASMSQIGGVLKGLPAYVPLPRLSKTQEKAILPATKAPQSEAQLKRSVSPAISAYYKVRRVYEDRNKHTAEYRKMVMQRIPSEGGMKLYLQLIEAKDRTMAGMYNDHRFVNDNRKAIMADARSIWENKTKKVSPALRKAMLKMADDIYAMRHRGPKDPDYIREIQVRDGRVHLHRQHSVFDGNKYNDFVKFLTERAPG